MVQPPDLRHRSRCPPAQQSGRRAPGPVYDALGRSVTTTDERGVTLTTTYDVLGRRTEVKQGGTTLSKWTYDTLAKGKLTSSTRYVSGAAYTTATDAFDDRYQPTSTTSTVPSAAGGLAGTYTWTYGYNQKTGDLSWTLNPAVGDIPAERVVTNYNSDDQPFRTSGQRGALVANTLYDVFSRPVRLEYSATLQQKAYQTKVYDEHTGQLIRQTTDRGMTAGYTKKSGKWVWKQAPKKDSASQKKYKNYQANPAHYMIDDKHARKYAANVEAQAKQEKIAREKEAGRRKNVGIMGSIRNWMNGNSDVLGYVGVGLGIVSMIVAVGAFYLGTALAVATTAEACTRQNWKGVRRAP
ncbi:RHS repeat domain-containing protein [Streptomyces sp. sk226]|uniref:RHS repeat domain-containing protein n=1 Tax=Streptomyces sp. sk226 TaxID=2034268 RepID=UPI000BEF56A1